MSSDMADDKELLSTAEVAKLLGVHRETVARWIRYSKLDAMKTPGGQYRVRREVVEELRRQLYGDGG